MVNQFFFYLPSPAARIFCVRFPGFGLTHESLNLLGLFLNDKKD